MPASTPDDVSADVLPPLSPLPPRAPLAPVAPLPLSFTSSPFARAGASTLRFHPVTMEHYTHTARALKRMKAGGRAHSAPATAPEGGHSLLQCFVETVVYSLMIECLVCV